MAVDIDTAANEEEGPNDAVADRSSIMYPLYRSIQWCTRLLPGPFVDGKCLIVVYAVSLLSKVLTLLQEQTNPVLLRTTIPSKLLSASRSLTLVL